MNMLEGVKVLSFTHFLQGPSASQMLADLGAEVIKIEPPTGAFERSWSGPDAYLNGQSVFFLLGNRNVKSVVLDLKAPGSRTVLDDLIRSADVLIESFRPGAMDRLGLGYEAARALNPKLVYCSLSGYGPDGPYTHRPGQDLLLQAMSGLAAATGREGDAPTPVGASIIDQHGAVLGAFGILAALLGRERTGRGTKVESNLLNAALDLQIEPLAYYLNGFQGQRSDSGISSRFYKAPYGVFRTRDGYLALSLNAPRILADAFEDDWFDAVASEDIYAVREEINRRVASHMVEKSCAEWTVHFEAKKIWFSPVNGYDEVTTDAQVLHNKSFIEFTDDIAGPVRVLGHPITYDGERPGLRTRPPELGEHTEEVLQSMGYDSTFIENVLHKKECA